MSDEEMYPVSDWKYEVANGDTLLGYAEWVEHQKEADGDPDTCRECGAGIPMAGDGWNGLCGNCADRKENQKGQ